MLGCFPLPRLTQIIVVVAVVDPHLAVVDFEDPGDQRTEEVAVVADQDDRPLEPLQGGKQHLAGLDVEVVGRFVKDQEVEGLGQEPGEDYPALLAAREVGDPFIHVVAGEEKGAAEIADDADVLKWHGLLHRLEDGLAGGEEVHGMLAEIAGGDAAADDDLACGGFGRAGDDLQER